MSVTLQKKGDATSSITLYFKSVSEDITSAKMKVGVGTGMPVYIRFGYEKFITATGQIHSSTDHAKLKEWDGDVILECTSSSYPEIEVTSASKYLVVDSAKITRKGGYVDQWDYTFKFIQADTSKLKRWS